MSVLTVGGRDVLLPRPERSSLTVPTPLSDFSIETLISGDSTSTYRRTLPVDRPLIAVASTPHDGVFGGAMEASKPSPASLGLQPLTESVGWTSHTNLAAMCRLLPTCIGNVSTGK